MARFTTRVELHGASYSDYEQLHGAMEREGFSRAIRSDQGSWYHLPTAEYDREGPLTTEQVLDSAKRAAATTGKKFGVLVTEGFRRTWFGLPAAQPAGALSAPLRR